MMVEGCYVIFAILGIALFRFLPPSRAALAVFLGGWVLLPVGNYPAGVSGAIFPYWITGLAIPSDMLLTKAWVAPTAAVLGMLLFDRAAILRLRRSWADVPVVLWCLWPLMQAAVIDSVRPAPVLASLYLAGSWGLPWLIGRTYFSGLAGQIELAKALALAGLACLPFGLVEAFIGPVFYDSLYETHPFSTDGAARYVGFRPLGLFENGNQYGIWISMCALASVWVAASTPSRDPSRRSWQIVAFVTAALAVAAQSVGGLLLACMGVAVLALSRLVRLRSMAIVSLAIVGIGGAIYVSGAVPVTRLAKETSIGQTAIAAFQAVGRGSFTWRIARDQELLPVATARPLEGTGHWDWWRAKEARPWGLALLLIGQFGIIGFVLSSTVLVGSAFSTAWRAPQSTPWRLEAAPVLLALIAALAALDSILNSFYFFPALLAAGALARTGARLSTADPRPDALAAASSSMWQTK